jgi:D-serine deaminase-like pyridoxal phosphate-dependent protein
VTELELDTPAAVVDLDRLERNLERWQRRCDELGLVNRPHVKTHKCTEIARRQVALGAGGLTCQTLGEAETMAAAGLDGLFLPTSVLGAPKLARLAALLERSDVIVGVDDPRVLPGLREAAERAGKELGVLVECDTGHGRAGVATPAAAAELGAAIARLDGLRFGGLFTYPSPPAAVPFLAAAAETTRREGLNPAIVSVGGTPAMWNAGDLLPTVTEYRAGTYAFHDRATIAAGAATVDDAAMTVAATVVSRPARDRAILDAGSKALSSDRGSDGFGLILEAPASHVVKLDEEHAYVELGPHDRLELGEQVRIVPNHACVVSNLFAELVLVRDGELAGSWAVDARGR